jgi:hypothetical protein
MRRLLRPSLVLLVAGGIAACARQGEPSASGVPAAPPQPAALAEAAAEIPHLTVRVLEVKRTGPDVITVALQLVNTGGPGEAVTLGSAFAADPRDAGSLADAFLWDEAGQRKYYLMRDDAGRPRSSVDTADLVPGEPREVWASFPAPPAGVSRLTICLPHVRPMRGVPVS